MFICRPDANPGILELEASHKPHSDPLQKGMAVIAAKHFLQGSGNRCSSGGFLAPGQSAVMPGSIEAHANIDIHVQAATNPNYKPRMDISWPLPCNTTRYQEGRRDSILPSILEDRQPETQRLRHSSASWTWSMEPRSGAKSEARWYEGGYRTLESCRVFIPLR
ncbi:hypothetical protein BC827DRAFT_1211576 [Russula dissimulans]|nr:hypothetical protein BC827DRAFT_1211576 [Russula dissimulans]